MPVGKRKRQTEAEDFQRRTTRDEDYAVHREQGKSNGPERSGLDLAKCLHSDSNDTIREALLHLRRVTALSGYDERPAASDKRIQLALEFLNVDIGAESSDTSGRSGLLQIWTVLETQNQASLLPLPIFALSNLIALLGIHQPNHHYVDRLLSNILPTQRSTGDPSTSGVNFLWNRLQMHLSSASEKRVSQEASSSHGSEVIIMAAIRLLHEMTNFAGGKYSKVIFDNMNWTMRSMPRLLNMRRRTKLSKDKMKAPSKDKAPVTLDRPDIRTLWILFLLSFLRLKSGILQPASLQQSALSLGKDALPAILKGLINDSSQVVVFVLMTLHEALLSNEAALRLPRSKVVGFFSEWACKELLSLYDRQTDLVSISGNSQERHSVADVIHHFMLALCSHPGRGVCYVDQGWYGRQVLDDDDKEQDERDERGFTVYNKILLGLLKSLSPARSTKQAELSVRILASSQELIAPYLNQQLGVFSSSNLEPRGAAIGWLSTIAFLGRVLSIPLSRATLWKQDPPSFERCLGSLLPSNLSKGLLQRAIQHKDAITRHGALILLSRLLKRLLNFKKLCREKAVLTSGIVRQAGSDWRTLWEDIVDEAKLCIPEMSILLASLHQKNAAKSSKTANEQDGSKKQTPLLIIEATLRAAKLHFDVFAELDPRESGFLLSDLLPSLDPTHVDDSSSGKQNQSTQLTSMCHMHAIQLLTTVAEISPGSFVLTATQGSKSNTPLRSLLNLARHATLSEVRSASWDLLAASMTDTILFEHDQQEWNTWQYALQHSSEDMLDLFDECVQRCLKNPYRYLQMAREEWSKVETDACISPLFYTIQEQYFIRLQNGLLATQKGRLAFPSFLTCFMPALHAHHRETISPSSDTPSMTVMNLTLQRLQDCISKSNDSQSQVDEQGDKLGTELDDMAAIKAAFHQALEALQSLIRGAADKRMLIVDDEDTLLSSPIRTEMMLIHCRNSIIKETGDTLEEVHEILRSIMRHGHPVSLVSFSLILNDEEVLARCSQDARLTWMLLDMLIELPIALDAVMAEDSAPTPFFSAAVEMAYSTTLTETIEESFELLRSSLVSLYSYLNESDQMRIWKEESNIDLLYDIALQLSQHLRWFDESRWTNLLDCLASSGRIEHLEKALLLLRELNKDMSFSTRSGLIAAQDGVIKLIIFKFEASELDTALRALLQASFQACQQMFKCLEAIEEDFGDLFAHLPLSTTEAMSRLQAQSIGTQKTPDLTQKAMIQRFIKSSIKYCFDNDDGIVIPFCHLCNMTVRQFKMDPYSLSDLLVSQMPEKPSQIFKQSILLFAAEMCLQFGLPWSSSSFVTNLVDMSLLWLVRRFAEDRQEDERTIKGIEAFLILLTGMPQIQLKSHLVEPVVSAAVINRSESLLHLRLIDVLMQMTKLKRTLVENVLVNLIGSKEALSSRKKRAKVIDIIYRAIKKDPSLCQLGLITSTIKLYDGSLIESDRKMLLIFRQYEVQCGVSVMNLFEEYWKLSSGRSDTEIDLGILSRMDYLRLHETSLKSPRARGFEDLKASGYDKNVESKETTGAVYDPLLVLSALGNLLSKQQSLSGLQWIELIRSNALGVLVCSLSSKMVATRNIAKVLLAKTYTSAQSAHFQEKDHLLLILDYARNSFEDKDRDQDQGSLPLTSTLFISFCFRSLGAPSLYLYPLVSRFLLQRPLPDSTDIPLLYNFLYSSSIQSTTYRAERTFILRFILICIKYGGKKEWNIIKRRHVWDSICTMYASGDTEISSRRTIEDIFLVVSRKRDIAFRVIVRHGFLQFLEQLLIQIQQSRGVEEEHTKHFILQCMANILESVDLHRLERAMGSSYLMPFTNLLAASNVLAEEVTSIKLLRDVLICLKHLHQHGIHLDLGMVGKSVEIMSDAISSKAEASNGDDHETLLSQCKSILESIRADEKHTKQSPIERNPYDTSPAHDIQV